MPAVELKVVQLDAAAREGRRELPPLVVERVSAPRHQHHGSARRRERREGADARVGDGVPERGFDGGREWQAFSRRVADGSATPSCVIEFPYADFPVNT